MERARSSSIVCQRISDMDDFFASLARAPRRLLLLDYDGTLAPFHVNPAWATPYDGVREALDGIMRDRRSTVVVVSGRPARDLLPLLNLRRAPDIWGSHGWERLDADGEYRCGPLDGQAIRALMQDMEWILAVKDVGGRIERKPGSVAVHWRGLNAESVKCIREAVQRAWTSRDLCTKLQWMDFDGGIELRLPGRNKGFVIGKVVGEQPKAATAYLGDDLTDEDAFKMIKGRGLGVLVRPAYRPTFAQAWLRPPEELLDFFHRWQAAGARRTL